MTRKAPAAPRSRRTTAKVARHVVQLVRGSVQIVLAALRRPPAPRRAPLVSVVIATYNWSSVLRYAIESVRHQSYSNWELIVVGDGCTDDSAAVVQSFDDSRIRWTNLPENTGSQSMPNNAGIALANGEYIAYHGHDDLWLPDHLARLVDALDRSDAGIASTVYETIGPPGSNFRLIPYLVYSGSFANLSTPSSSMHRRDCVAATGGWRDYREIVEPPDGEFIDRLAAAHGAVAVPALTVCKFNSALRRNSYVERRSDEQSLWSERIARERFFALRELATVLWLLVRRPEIHLPAVPEPPVDMPPGWFVTEWRRIRGLEPPLEDPPR